MKRLTEENKLAFLSSLKAGRTITESCKEAGISRRIAYYWKDEDQSFSDLWDEAQAIGVEVFESELKARALDRDDPKSMQALTFLLKKLDPSYKESYKTEQTIRVENARELDFSPGELEEAKKILDAARDR